MEILETGVDELVETLKKNEEFKVEDLVKELGYPKEVIEDWVEVLEEHGIASINYGLTSTTVKLKEHEEEKKEKAKEKLKKKEKKRLVCDKCGRSFETERGLKTHSGMIHKGG